MDVAEAVFRQVPMQILLRESPLASHPADDALVSQERVQVAPLQSERLADLGGRVAELAVLVQLLQLFA